MESKSSRNPFFLFPVYFKAMGAFLIVAAPVPLIIRLLTNVEHSNPDNYLLKVVTLDALILGLSFIAMSKDKVEDELTMFIRLRAMAAAFITGIVFVIVKPLVDLLFSTPSENITAPGGILTMLLFYIMTYYYQKRLR
jgi:hypothetical protein